MVRSAVHIGRQAATIHAEACLRIRCARNGAPRRARRTREGLAGRRWGGAEEERQSGVPSSRRARPAMARSAVPRFSEPISCRRI